MARRKAGAAMLALSGILGPDVARILAHAMYDEPTGRLRDLLPLREIAQPILISIWRVRCIPSWVGPRVRFGSLLMSMLGGSASPYGASWQEVVGINFGFDDTRLSPRIGCDLPSWYDLIDQCDDDFCLDLWHVYELSRMVDAFRPWVGFGDPVYEWDAEVLRYLDLWRPIDVPEPKRCCCVVA